MRKKVLKISTIEFANKLDVSQSAVSKYESGYILPGFEFIFKVCSVFNTSANWLIFDILPIRLSEVGAIKEDSTIKSVNRDKEIQEKINTMSNMLEEIKTQFNKK
nr:helix-turn-helix transcriptional regulator [Pseudopedobacter sp.]